MRFLLKLLVAPIIGVLTIVIWFCALGLRCSACVFGVAGSVIGILGLLALLVGSVKDGIILLVIAILASPLGLPMLAAWLLGQLQRLQLAIQVRIFG